MKKYERIENSKKELKIEVYYDKGGMNYFNSKVEPRGYWISVRAVERDIRDNGICIESYPIMSGVKHFLLEVKRQSDKAYDQAIALHTEILPTLKENILQSI
jgi:hypothetical protein